MRRFFFNLNECGDVTHDDEGHELRDEAGARVHAVEQARSIMCAEVAEGRLCLGCTIEVLDDRSALVAIVPFRDALALCGT